MTDLRIDAREAENGTMRFTILLPVVALVFFGGGLTGMAQASKSSQSAPQPDARIDINHVSVNELMKAPGMTRTWAERIVRFRPYRTKLELLEHGIVSGVVYDRIKDYVIAHREKQ